MARTPAFMDRGECADQRALEAWQEDGGHYEGREDGSDEPELPSAPAEFIFHVLPDGEHGTPEVAAAQAGRGAHLRPPKT
jgi:hypothetical protein